MLYEKLRYLATVRDRGHVFVDESGAETKCPFAELVAGARRVRGQLAAQGYVKGDRIGIAIADSRQCITAFLGTVMAGIIPVPMCPPFVVGEVDGYVHYVRQILQAAGARAVIASPRTAPILERARAQATATEAVLVYDQLASAPEIAAGDAELTPDDICFLQFTSGSTAAPKGVMVSHRNLMANARAMLVDKLALDPRRDIGINWLPLYHDMGLVGNVLAALLVEVPVVYLPTLSFIKHPRSWMAAVSRYRGTVTFGPNFAYGLAARHASEAHVQKLDLSCLRVAGCGAEPIDGEMLRHFARVFAPAKLNPNAIMPCYGMAEATLGISFDTTLKPPRYLRIERSAYEAEGVVKIQGDADPTGALEIVSCGTTFPGHEVAIFSPSGERLPQGTVGEIAFRGPSVAVGYYNNPEDTSRVFRNGWLHTGDLGFLLEGEVFVSGRLKDVIIVNGRNYYPQDIEWCVEKVNGVRRGHVAAFGVHNNGLEKVIVVAEVKGGASREQLRRTIRQATISSLGIHSADVVLVAAGALAKTTSGKIQRQKTKAAYLEGRFEESELQLLA